MFSPVSITHTLLMARAAADAATGSAIDALLELPEGQAAHEAWNSIDQTIASDVELNEEITLEIADRIWPAIDLMPSQQWLDLLASHHGATVTIRADRPLLGRNNSKDLLLPLDKEPAHGPHPLRRPSHPAATVLTVTGRRPPNGPMSSRIPKLLVIQSSEKDDVGLLQSIPTTPEV